MPKWRNSSVEERSAVVTLSDEGHLQRATCIVQKLKISQCVQSRVFSKSWHSC